MARDDKPLQLKPVDDDAEPEVIIRLESSETAQKEKPIRLKVRTEDTEVSRRLDLPDPEGAELRTHQPGIDELIGTDAFNPDLLEQNWGEASANRRPVPWGWFALIGLLILAAVFWSLGHMRQGDVQAEKIRSATESALVDEAKEEQEAGQLVGSIEQTIRDFFSAKTIESLSRFVRHPERVTPLMRRYYSENPMSSDQLKSIKLLQPLTLDNRGNFWMGAVVLANGQQRNLLIEIQESGNVRIDWETLVCYQPMKWDDYAAQRPAGTSMDFRVYVERDSFFSHEFADSEHWQCFRLTALDSEETLFGYAPVGSAEAKFLLALLDQHHGEKSAMILRLTLPEGLQSRRGVVIEKLLSNRWVYVTPPDSGS